MAVIVVVIIVVRLSTGRCRQTRKAGRAPRSLSRIVPISKLSFAVLGSLTQQVWSCWSLSQGANLHMRWWELCFFPKSLSQNENISLKSMPNINHSIPNIHHSIPNINESSSGEPWLGDRQQPSATLENGKHDSRNDAMAKAAKRKAGQRRERARCRSGKKR